MATLHGSLCVILVISMLTVSNCIYFQLYDTKEKCLFEDLPKHEVIIGDSNLMDEVAPLSLVVYDPKSNAILTQDIPFGKGKFSFTTREEGVFKVCVKPADGDWRKERKKIKYSLKLYSGESSNYEDLANVEHLSQLQILIKKLDDHAQDFIKMQEMNRHHEALQVEVL